MSTILFINISNLNVNNLKHEVSPLHCYTNKASLHVPEWAQMGHRLLRPTHNRERIH